MPSLKIGYTHYKYYLLNIYQQCLITIFLMLHMNGFKNNNFKSFRSFFAVLVAQLQTKTNGIHSSVDFTMNPELKKRSIYMH